MPTISGSLEGSSPPGGAGGSWTPPKAEPEAGACGAGLGEAAVAGTVSVAGATGAAAGASALALAFAGDALAAGAGQGLGAAAVDVDEDAAGFFLKSELICLAASFTFCASAEATLFCVVEPFCAVVAPQAACDAFCAPVWLLCARTFEENVRIISRVRAKKSSAVNINARRIVTSAK